MPLSFHNWAMSVVAETIRVFAPVVLGLVCLISSADSSKFLYGYFVFFSAIFSAIAFFFGLYIYMATTKTGSAPQILHYITLDAVSFFVSNGIVTLLILLNSRTQSTFYIGGDWETKHPVLLLIFGVLYAMDFVLGVGTWAGRMADGSGFISSRFPVGEDSVQMKGQ